MYKLKLGKESFTPVEGPFAGRKFIPGQLYSEIPPGTAGRFEAVKKTAASAGDTLQQGVPSVPVTKPAKADNKKAFVNPPAEKGGDKL